LLVGCDVVVLHKASISDDPIPASRAECRFAFQTAGDLRKPVGSSSRAAIAAGNRILMRLLPFLTPI
jgi:hypothetical protein